MALELVAAHAFNNLGPVIGARGVVDGNAGALEARAGPNTVNIFIDSPDVNNYEYAASVVTACLTETVYEIRCTSGPSKICGTDAPTVTITENASTYIVSSAITTKTAGVQVKATVVENCSLAGKTAATCTATIAGSVKGKKYSTSATVTYAHASALHVDVSVTGGNEKLASPTACNGAPAANTRAVAFWGFLGAIAAVGVLAL